MKTPFLPLFPRLRAPGRHNIFKTQRREVWCGSQFRLRCGLWAVGCGVSSASLQRCPGLLKGPRCPLITGRCSRSSIFLRSLARPLARNTPPVPLPVSYPWAVQSQGAARWPLRARPGAPPPKLGEPGGPRSPAPHSPPHSLPVRKVIAVTERSWVRAAARPLVHAVHRTSSVAW